MTEKEKIDKNSPEHLMSDLEAVAAHQLKVPLARNKWGLSYILKGGLGDVPHLQREILESVFQNNERAIRIANEILIAQGVESDSVQALEAVDLGGLIAEVMAEFEPEASAKGITLSLSQDFKPHVLGVKDRINYVLENIIGDALQYTQEGGKITLSLLKENSSVVISISDTGIGIPDEEQEHIFKKFFRANNARAHDVDGTGLGLYVSKKIIESFGGSIQFKSKEGQGTTFLISLPIQEGV